MIEEPPLTITALDTNKISLELRAVGFTDEQAEAVTRVIGRSQNIGLSDTITRTGYQSRLITDLQLGLAAVRADLQIGLAETKFEILKLLVVGALSVQTIIILGAVAALAQFVPR